MLSACSYVYVDKFTACVQLSLVYYDWWTFKRTGSAVRTSKHYAKLRCYYWRIWEIELSATVLLVGLSLLNGTLLEVGSVNIQIEWKKFRNPPPKKIRRDRRTRGTNSWLDDTDKILVPICLYCLNCTKFGQLIVRKSLKLLPTDFKPS